MTEITQELMTPDETARWFRRSLSWLRQQPELVRLAGPGGQPLYHLRVCRAYVFGRMRGLTGEALRETQLQALAAACGLPAGKQATSDKR
jgi:hypothetical protein